MFSTFTKSTLFSSIRHRIMLYLLVFGLLIAVILSSFAVYINYQSDLNRVQTQFEQIQNSFVGGISNSLWSLNTNLTQIQIDGIQALPNIIYVGIVSNDSIYAETGLASGSTQLISRQYPLTYLYRNELQALGTLSVIADTSDIRSDAVSGFGEALLFEIISVASVVFLVSALMNNMILKHVIKISQFMREIAKESILPTLQLDRPKRTRHNLNSRNENDELDVLVNAFNYLQREREIATTALHFSEEKFSKAFHSSPQVLMISSQIDGAIIEINSAFTRICGWSRSETIGKTTIELGLWSPEYRHSLQQQLLVDAVRNFEIIFKTKSGESRLATISADVIDIEDIPCFITMAEDITDRKKNEKEILDSRKRLRQLANRLEEIREEERSGIARELHDELGQSLTSLKIDLTNLSENTPSTATDNHLLIDAMISNIDTTVDVVRRISSELRPPVLDDLGLEAALEWLTTGFAKRTGLLCTLTLDCDELVMNKAWDTAIFRIFQESLVNIARHSKAKSFEADVRIVDNALRVDITDDGIGITQQQKRHISSIGLIGMQERATHIGATLSINNIASGGTKVTLLAPISRLQSSKADAVIESEIE